MNETQAEKCTHCGQLILQSILRKFNKFDATRCQILRLKCTKFDFRCGSAPDPAAGAYSAPPDIVAIFKGPTSNGREGVDGLREWKEKEGEGVAEGRREGGEGLLPDAVG